MDLLGESSRQVAVRLKSLARSKRACTSAAVVTANEAEGEGDALMQTANEAEGDNVMETASLMQTASAQGPVDRGRRGGGRASHGGRFRRSGRGTRGRASQASMALDSPLGAGDSWAEATGEAHEAAC